MPSTPLGILARVQALILYCIIRAFDGDIQARASAERHFDQLEAYAMALVPHIVFLPDPSNPDSTNESSCVTTPDELPLYPLATTEVFWKDWIFQESARRTLLFAFTLMVIYDLMTSQKCCSRKNLIFKTWTMSAHLWKAPTAVEFAEAWRTKRHFIMSSTKLDLFSEVVREGDPDDLDSLGKMFMTTHMGVTAARRWFLSKGSIL